MKDRTTSQHDMPSMEALREELSRVAAADAGRPPPRRPGVLVAVIVVFGVAATAVVAFLLAPRDRGEPASVTSPSAPPTAEPEETVASPTSPRSGGFAGHGAAYQTLVELARASDLIVVGTVERTRVAREIGEGPDDPFPTRILHTTVALEEVLKGSDPDGRVVVPTQELAFGAPGVEDWREPGQRVLLFLTPSRESPERHILANLNYVQTAYLIRGAQLEMTVLSGDDVEGLSQRIDSMSVQEVREAVRSLGG